MNPTLFLNADTGAPVNVDLPGNEVLAFLKPLAPEHPNQDSAAVFDLAPGRCVLVVADGMGGGPAGDRASSIAVQALEQCLHQSQSNALPTRSAILDGFELAQAQVNQHAPGAATTLMVVEIEGDQARTYHVGDSMACVFGQRGKMKLKTTSHSPVGYAVKSGMLDEEQALHHEDRHYVSNMIGFAEMSLEVGHPMTLAARDTLVIGSDGLFDNLSIEEIVAHSRAGPLPRAVQTLSSKVGQRMTGAADGQPSKPDDLAIVAHRFRSGKPIV